MASTFVVKESFVGNLGSGDVIFRAGEPIDSTNKAVKKWPHLFTEQTSRLDEATIEQATAAPGEKRSLASRIKTAGKVAAPRKATAAEEKAIAATVEAEAASGTAMTTAALAPEDDDGDA